jgi:peptidyl-prolyl cis-trans isomerase B (cyclophilin B)
MNDGGVIYGELYPQTAPQSVGNFVELANKGFYNGLIFHRVIPGFMIQGGDPAGNGTGGPGYAIKGEFTSNGVTNNLKHEAGVLSMARTNQPDSASTQFFIMHEAAPHLDGKYASFGKVVEGIEIVDKICKDATPTDSDGAIPAAEQPIIESVTITVK